MMASRYSSGLAAGPSTMMVSIGGMQTTKQANRQSKIILEGCAQVSVQFVSQSQAFDAVCEALRRAVDAGVADEAVFHGDLHQAVAQLPHEPGMSPHAVQHLPHYRQVGPVQGGVSHAVENGGHL